MWENNWSYTQATDVERGGVGRKKCYFLVPKITLNIECVFFFLIIITLYKLNYNLPKFYILCQQKNFSDSQRNISARQHCWNSCAYVTPVVDAFPGIVKIICVVKLVQLFCTNKTQDGQMLLNFSSFPQLYCPFSFLCFSDVSHIYLQFSWFLIIILTCYQAFGQS